MSWITVAGTVVGGILGWFMHLWRSKEEIGKMRDEREKMREEKRQMEHSLNVLSCSEWIHFVAHNEKISAGTHDVLFSEDELYQWAKNVGWDVYVQPALQLLKEKKLAEQSLIPGQWYIDRPAF